MDYDRLTPVEKKLRRIRRIRRIIIFLLALLGIYHFVFNKTYTPYYDSELTHFNHGSIGSESANGIPYWIFRSLPDLFKDKMGHKGWAYFGFLYADDAELPIGFSQRRVQGISRVWLNCAGCHTGSYIDPTDHNQKLIFGAPANNLRLLDFIQFFRDAATDNRFTADNILKSIENVGGDLNFIEKLLYRYVIVDRVRTALLDLRNQLDFLDREDFYDWGPGRVDTFNPYKAIQFNFPMDASHMPAIALNGSSDYPSVWMQRPREGMQLHWDGNNISVAERNLSAALGAGVTPVSVDRNSLLRIKAWLMDYPAPQYPLLNNLNKGMVDKGRHLYSTYCSDCHGQGTGQEQPRFDYDTNKFTQMGTVVPLADIGTDKGRYLSYTENFSGAQNMLYAGYPWRFSHFKKTKGYANHPLDGIWARSPYLHNGSVPTLRDLLETSANRPSAFYRGSKKYDWQDVGYRAYAEAAVKGQKAPEADLFLFKTSVLGNSNSGHEGDRYGTNLTPNEKDAIVEYMKTL